MLELARTRYRSPSWRVVPGRNPEMFFTWEDNRVTFVPLDLLYPHPLAHLRLPRGWISGIARALQVAPFVSPVIAEEDNTVVGRLDIYLAAQRLHWSQVPVIRTMRLSSVERRQYERQLAGEPLDLIAE